MDESLEQERKFIFSRYLLGPVFAEFCRRLWLYQEVYSKEEACALFCARGGIRLRMLYETFLRKMEIIIVYLLQCLLLNQKKLILELKNTN